MTALQHHNVYHCNYSETIISLSQDNAIKKNNYCKHGRSRLQYSAVLVYTMHYDFIFSMQNRVSHYDYGCIHTAMLHIIQLNVSCSALYQYLQSNPGRYCVWSCCVWSCVCGCCCHGDNQEERR